MRFLFLLLALNLQAIPSLYTVLPTGSMEPTLNEHYYLFVDRLPFVDLKVGDVLVVVDSVQYEMDCSAWIPPCDVNYRHARGEIPFTGGIKSFPSHAGLCQLAMDCAGGGNGCCPRLILGRLATGES